MTESSLHGKTLHDIALFGLRVSIGVIFIVQGYGKIDNPGFPNMLASLGIPVEMQIIIAMGELIPGIVMVVGVLSRIAASILSIIMLGAIFLVKEAASLMGQGGFALDLMLLASCLVVIVAGPGRVSLAHVIKKLPRSIH